MHACNAQVVSPAPLRVILAMQLVCVSQSVCVRAMEYQSVCVRAIEYRIIANKQGLVLQLKAQRCGIACGHGALLWTAT
jgi:hypothetical protein